MPAKDKKRIKPVIEEIVETPAESTPEVAAEEQKEVPPQEPQVYTEPTSEPEPEAVAEPVAPEPVEAPHEPHHKKEHKKMNLKLIIVITLVSALVAAFVSGGVYVYLSGVEGSAGQESTPSPTPASTSTPEPSATPEPEPVDLSEYSVQVLNGSGAPGAAGGGEEVMASAGFTVEATGNAANYNFTNTVVQAKASVPEQAVDEARSALESEDYEVEVGSTLPDSSQYDIVVTIGRN